MAKKSDIENNQRKMRMAKKFAGRRARLLGIANDDGLSMEERFEARLKLSLTPRNASAGRIRNSCEVTGRPRAYYRKFKMSRIALRELGTVSQETVRWLRRRTDARSVDNVRWLRRGRTQSSPPVRSKNRSRSMPTYPWWRPPPTPRAARSRSGCATPSRKDPALEEPPAGHRLRVSLYDRGRWDSGSAHHRCGRSGGALARC